VPKFLSSPAKRSPSSTSPSCTGTSGERETSGYSIANIFFALENCRNNICHIGRVLLSKYNLSLKINLQTLSLLNINKIGFYFNGFIVTKIV
jgi:hypothetical protein